jgi:hypothetical protein
MQIYVTLTPEEMKAAIAHGVSKVLGRPIDPAQVYPETESAFSAVVELSADAPAPAVRTLPGAELKSSHSFMRIDGKTYGVYLLDGGDVAVVRSPEGKTYTVEQTWSDKALATGNLKGYECSCPDYQFRRAPGAKDRDGKRSAWADTPCKHLTGLQLHEDSLLPNDRPDPDAAEGEERSSPEGWAEYQHESRTDEYRFHAR